MRTKDDEINMVIDKLKEAVKYLEENQINYAITGRMRDFILGSPVFPMDIEILTEKDVDLEHPIKVKRSKFEAEERDFYGMKIKIEKRKE